MTDEFAGTHACSFEMEGELVIALDIATDEVELIPPLYWNPAASPDERASRVAVRVRCLVRRGREVSGEPGHTYLLTPKSARRLINRLLVPRQLYDDGFGAGR